LYLFAVALASLIPFNPFTVTIGLRVWMSLVISSLNPDLRLPIRFAYNIFIPFPDLIGLVYRRS
jgi:hypothetical protein